MAKGQSYQYTRIGHQHKALWIRFCDWLGCARRSDGTLRAGAKISRRGKAPRRLTGWALVLCTPALAGGCAGIDYELTFQSVARNLTGIRIDRSATATNRYKVGKPYVIRGKTYRPREDFSYTETGIASWYGHPFHGRKTASGAVYDMNRMTAAHRTLPLPSLVRVTNLDNGRKVELLVNDRGPFAFNRIIDVSSRAAAVLGFHRKGTTRVRVDILSEPSRALKAATLAGATITAPGSGGGGYASNGQNGMTTTSPWPLWGTRPWRHGKDTRRFVITQHRSRKSKATRQGRTVPLWRDGHGGWYSLARIRGPAT